MLEEKSSLSSLVSLGKTGLAFTFCMLQVWGLILSDQSYLLVPGYLGSMYYGLRGFAAALGGAIALVLVVLALKNPSVFNRRVWSIASIIANGIGIGFLFFDLGTSTWPMYIAGFALCSFSSTWSAILVGAAAIKHSERARAKALSFGYVLKVIIVYIATPLISVLSSYASLVALLFPCFVFFLTHEKSDSVFELITHSAAQSDLEITNPASFLPFSNKLFVTILLFTCACGFGFSVISPQDFSWQNLAVISLLVVCIVAILLFNKKRLEIDDFFTLAITLTTVGLVAGPVWADDSIISKLGYVILVAGCESFLLFMYLLLFKLAARNAITTISLIAFSGVAINLGMLIDTLFWIAARSISKIDVIPRASIILFFFLIFITYCLVFVRRLNFEDTVRSISPVPSFVPSVESPSLVNACEKIANAYSLTAREKEIFELLARGRNGRFIREKLFISQSTVKTHVRNIYAKLDIHSHQELIDLIEHPKTD